MSDVVAPTVQSLLFPGSVVASRYRIVAALGRGGMGEVYRADDLKLGQPVALKFLRTGLQWDARHKQRFLDEVRIARQVSHANVCRVYDVGEVDDQLYLSMEYVDGEDLASLLRRIGRLPPEKAVQVSQQICAGVAAAHELGILHRDLKPANVMIDGRGRVKVTDFGLAGLEHAVEGTDVRAGTPAYMAPEQLAGIEVTVRSDVYALGLVLYEVFTGKPAFKSGSFAELIRLRNETTPSRPSSHVEGIDPAVEEVILRCLEREARDRPASALAVAAALPGGNLVAAAIAAGETPSPEMVADVGPAGGLPPAIGAACLAVCLLGLAGLPFLYDSASLVGRVSLDLPPEALVVKARESIRAAGHASTPLDSAHGFAYDQEYLRYAEAQDAASRWADPEHVRPAPVYFWYRQSPEYLTPTNGGTPLDIARVTADDPQAARAGMVGARLDPEGRLLRLEAIPDASDLPASDATEPDWTALSDLAGIDLSAATPVPSAQTPLFASDVQRAWSATYRDGSQEPLTIEASAFRGRVTSFVVRPPWGSTLDAAPAPWDRGQTTAAIVGTLVVVTTLGAGLLLARRNLARGRGDRRGAFRVALFVFICSMLQWMFGADHQPTFAGVALLVQGAAWSLFNSACLWTVYMALEPYARRIWPEILASWNRVLQARWRDPLIGRDILVGMAAGLVATSIALMHHHVEPWLGLVPAPTVNVGLEGLTGIRQSLAGFFGLASTALGDALLFLFLLLLLRTILRKPLPAAIAFVLVLALPNLVAEPSPISALPLLLYLALLVLVLVRIGFLAAVAFTLVSYAGIVQPLTSDFSSWYAGRSWLLIALLAAVAIYAFRVSLVGRPLIRVSRFDVRGAEAR